VPRAELLRRDPVAVRDLFGALPRGDAVLHPTRALELDDLRRRAVVVGARRRGGEADSDERCEPCRGPPAPSMEPGRAPCPSATERRARASERGCTQQRRPIVSCDARFAYGLT